MRFVRLEARVHGHVPMPLVRLRSAFYGILLGHENGPIVAEEQVLRSDARVVRERVSLHDECRAPATC